MCIQISMKKTTTRKKTKNRFNFTLNPEVIKKAKQKTIRNKDYNSLSDFVEKSIQKNLIEIEQNLLPSKQYYENMIYLIDRFSNQMKEILKFGDIYGKTKQSQPNKIDSKLDTLKQKIDENNTIISKKEESIPRKD